MLATVQVYLAQLVWGDWKGFPDVDTAFVHVAGRAGGVVLFGIVSAALLIATIGSGTGAHLGAARLLYGMGRSDALPRSFFGAIDPRTRIPRNNVLVVGGLALVGGLLLSFQLGAEMLNFGAFIAFMGVNLAAFTHYWLRGAERRWQNFVLPLLGFLICLYLWVSLRWPAKLAGGAWLAGRRRPLRRLEDAGLPAQPGLLRAAAGVTFQLSGGHYFLRLMRARVAEPRADGNCGHLRRQNLERLLAIVMDQPGTFTRAELIEATGLSAPTVGSLVCHLIRSGIVRDLGAGPSRGGRRPSFMEFNARHGYIAGIDLGPTRTRLAVADLRGELLAHDVVATPAKLPPGEDARAPGRDRCAT